jgi:hypothetical protein
MMKSSKKIALLGSLACAVLAGAPASAQTVERIYPPSSGVSIASVTGVPSGYMTY